MILKRCLEKVADPMGPMEWLGCSVAQNGSRRVRMVISEVSVSPPQREHPRWIVKWEDCTVMKDK